MLLEKLRDPGHVRAATPADLLGSQRGRNVHAVQDVANIVQHARGDLRHAGLARGVAQLPVRFFQRRVAFFALGDVAHDGG